MARCSLHSYSYNTGRDTQRGRPVNYCDDCRRLTEENKAKRAEKVLSRVVNGYLTRAAGKLHVEKEYDKQVSALTNQRDAEVRAASKQYDDWLATDERYLHLTAEIDRLTRERYNHILPRAQEKEAAQDRARKTFSAAMQPLGAWKQRALENLEMRCHVMAGSKMCDRYLDYEGKCPIHGEIEEPGQ